MSAVAKHTLGPWIAAPFSSIVGAPVVSQQGRTVAKVSYPYVPGMPQDAIDECVANGQLIAAAPDLLASLREIKDMLWARPDIVAMLRPLMGFAEQAISERASAAIAKAEGRPF